MTSEARSIIDDAKPNEAQVSQNGIDELRNKIRP